MTGQARSVTRASVFLVVMGVGLLLMGLALPVANLGISHGLVPLYISPSVLFVPATLDAVGLGALALGIALLAAGRTRHRSEFRAWWQRTGRSVTVSGVVVFVVVTALLVVPVRQSFSAQLSIGGGNVGGITNELFPPGTVVTGSWSTSPKGPVNFTIQGGSYSGDVYTANGSSGTFSFATTGSPWALYDFFGTSSSPETVNIGGTFTAPTWQWPPGEPGEPTVLPVI